MRNAWILPCCVVSSLLLPASCSDVDGVTDAGMGGVGGEGAAGGGGTPAIGFPCTEQGVKDAIAEGGGPHVFACDGPTSVVTEAEIVIDNDVILDGEGNLKLEANGNHRVLSVIQGVTTTVEGIDFSNGGGVADGGGLHNEGTLTLRDSSIANSSASDEGGGIYNAGSLVLTNVHVSGSSAVFGGGIFNEGTLTSDCPFPCLSLDENMAVAPGEDRGGNGGGLYIFSGRVELTNAAIRNNTALRPASATAGGNGGGISNASGELDLLASEVSGNSAQGDGGGIKTVNPTSKTTVLRSTISGNTVGPLFLGGGLQVLSGEVLIRNSTIADNTARLGGGIHVGGGPFPKVEVNFCTLFANTGTTDSAAFRGGLLLKNSLVGGDCSGNARTEGSGGNVFTDPETCDSPPGIGEPAVAPFGGSLSDNGGPTQTVLPANETPPVNHIEGGDCNEIPFDQRGEPRVVGGKCDAGAVELQAAELQ